MGIEFIDISIVLEDKDYFEIKSMDTNIVVVGTDISIVTEEKNLFELNYDL